MTKIRKFDSGAVRDTNIGKLEYARFLSPLALKKFSEYMNKHRTLADGSTREPDDWKKGFPLQSFMDSMFRHVVDVWLIHEGHESIRPETGEKIELDEALCGVMFNSMGYLHEILKKSKNP